MAQKRGKEETEFKVPGPGPPETLTLCVNNCGFTGNPATNNMCQKCFNTVNAAATATAGSIISSHKASGSSSSRSPRRFSAPRSDVARRDLKLPSAKESNQAKRQVVNRCSGCRRKVGLTGFRCRCGDLFCAEHRYSDRHDCSYDYKAAGRKAIARENPIVKPAKIVKI